MEQLLDLADTLANSSDTPQRPDFPIPEEYASLPTLLQLKDIPNKGKAWFASQSITAGTVLMVSKPIVMAMDWEDEISTHQINQDDMDEEEEEEETQINEIILLQVLRLLEHEPHLWENTLTHMYPREKELEQLQSWVCNQDSVFLHVENILGRLEQIPSLKDQVKMISQRLPLIIRYNVLSVETCPELLSYPTTHAALSGVALYYEPSFFNHSSKPNCCRYAIGDIMFLVANQDIPASAEVMISYLEHDVLCEPAYRKNILLGMDFEERDDISPTDEDDGPEIPVVDTDVQNELMQMNPIERLSAIEELMLQATGQKAPEDDEEFGEDGMEMSGVCWFQCDVQNLRILKAITLDGLGQTEDALELWKESVSFVDQCLPPNDESGIVLRVQAALAALHTGEREMEATEYAKDALRVHELLFGGGVERFRRRMRGDLELDIRPGSNGAEKTSLVDILWPIQSLS